jgi:hypothetical protein
VSDTALCPECGEQIVCESVDVGVGTIYGPAYCECGWSEYALAGKVVDGWYHDAAGGAQRVDAIVSRARELGGDALAELCADAFSEGDA